jgi:mannosyltransferase OCH1-like enzyme
MENRKLVEEHYVERLPLYDGYEDVNIKRIHTVRYLYLDHYGGVYMDMDFTCLQLFGSEFDVPETSLWLINVTNRTTS